MRTITIYSTSGSDGKAVLTDVTTWGSLQNVLSENGVKHDKMKAVIGENRNTLESANAELPAGNFTLFLMPVKVKSGTDVKDMSYKELRTAIKEAVTGNSDAEKHFNKDKNYTNKSTEEMRSLLKSWLSKLGKTTTAPTPVVKEEAIPEQKKVVAEVVEATKKIAEAKATVDPDIKAAFIGKLADVRKGLASMITDIDMFILENTVTEKVSLDLHKEKKQELKNMANDIAKDFSDIQRY